MTHHPDQDTIEIPGPVSSPAGQDAAQHPAAEHGERRPVTGQAEDTAQDTASQDSAEESGVRAWFREQFGEFPEFVEKPRPSLQQLRAYSEAGDWTPARTGPARTWHLRYTRLIAIPVAAIAYATQWAAERPGRAAFVLTVLLVLCTALNSVPVLGLLIPDWMSLTYWPPLSWLS